MPQVPQQGAELAQLQYDLLGREFTLCMDHSPSKWTATANDTSAMGLIPVLQDYRFRVDHRPGREHADGFI